MDKTLTECGIDSSPALAAETEQNVFIPCSRFAKVKPSPGNRTILVKGGVMEKPIRLYCTVDTYARAEAVLRDKCPGAAFA